MSFGARVYSETYGRKDGTIVGGVGLWGSRRLKPLPGHNVGRCDGSVMSFVVYVTASNAAARRAVDSPIRK
jgi:hypothetical protein